ncbi:MAG: ATP-binding protein [Candidatus Binatus sp.]|jgi:signal transduction histidine kinase|uniref:GAF domain-containing sensor histidine kinase n=1 Tax=Candidatus Binatus sp. TaxID=2811406 RepID=UPI003C76402D
MQRRATSATIEPKRDRTARVGRERREAARFESLVGELSAAMARVPAEEVDVEIERWLGKICLALDLDRSAVYERDSPDDPVRATHTWVRPNFPAFPRNYDPEKLLQRSTQLVMSGKMLVFARPSEIPAENRDTRRFVERYGPKASAAIPMWAGGKVIGAATFGKFRSARKWPLEVLDNLALAARLFGSAIERKQAEIAIGAVRSELRFASRRNLMSELVASLSHEINQPLGAILSNLGGLARLLARGNPEPAMALEAVNNAVEDTKRTAEIVRRIRFMFKRHVEHKTAIGIGALIDEVVKLTAGEASVRKIAVQVEISPPGQRVTGDSIQLQQCVLNLVMNAFDAITEAGSARRDVAIKVAPEKIGWVGVSICDSGTGIAPAVAKRLFEPFVTTKSEGMGLGLLVTRSIVESHGGRIWASPNPDQGTTFTFTLPVAQTKRAGASRRIG